ncbi:hypothetical protein J1N35_020891 [Gossypium stocksii]|uniref:Uncharacterized protein n=1 Tax=Gossypium stocksii TaxID=47602 RepID=A0A9D4A1F9_9ROSI|nr:hypothetical protein J1N35_020891 [Gossypium stocksii]
MEAKADNITYHHCCSLVHLHEASSIRNPDRRTQACSKHKISNSSLQLVIEGVVLGGRYEIPFSEKKPFFAQTTCIRNLVAMPRGEFKSWIVANPDILPLLYLSAMQHLFKSSYCVISPQSMVMVEKTIRFLEMVGESKCKFPLPVKRIISILGLKRIERK